MSPIIPSILLSFMDRKKSCTLNQTFIQTSRTLNKTIKQCVKLNVTTKIINRSVGLYSRENFSNVIIRNKKCVSTLKNPTETNTKCYFGPCN